MRKSPTFLLAATLGALSFGFAAVSVYAQEKAPAEPTGQQLAFDNKKGNCLACHMIPGDSKAITSATIAPPLVAMKARFPDKAKLRAQIWDATKANPMSVMPPFGKNQVLTDAELDKVLDYVYGL